MKKEEKARIIDTIYEQVQAKPHMYVTDIAGMDAAATSALRRSCFKNGVKLIMVKNTLLEKALEKTGIDFSELAPAFKGTTAIMLSDVNKAPATVIKEFRKRSELPILKGAYVEESFYLGDASLESLVQIKSKNELIGEIVTLLQSPIQSVMGALESAPNKVAGLVEALAERPEQA